ncbi:MAG TPA: four helix bundle protein, partial [Candidatus Cybelea sp.]|nr:four helix bundle protein [Candidatus Cybelea sp.]
TAAFPREERYGLAAQMRRAAISIGSNVFEGAGKQTNKAFAASLYVAFSEGGELLFQVRVAVRLKFGDDKLAAKLRRAIERIRQMLIRLIQKLEASQPDAPKQRGVPVRSHRS